MKSVLMAVTIGVALGAAVPPVSAQVAGRDPQPALRGYAGALNVKTVPGAPRDPLADAFFAPDLVMQHQQRIGLTAEQRAAIIRAIQEAQPRFVEAQWQLEPETAALAEMVRGTRVDERRVLQQIDRVLEIERQIKRSQVELLVQIKNQLTEEQQTALAQLGGSSGFLQFYGRSDFFRR